MSHFAAFFPADDSYDPSRPSFDKLEETFRDKLHEESVTTHRLMGTGIIISGSSNEVPRFFSNDRGWIVIAGLMFDARSDNPEVEPEGLLDRLLQRQEPDLGRYEGIFAVAAWDREKRTAVVVNDQPSCLNCYYGEYEGGLYVTTCALPLARSLRIPLNPRGICELLSRGTLVAPTAMFAGLRRIDVGEHVRYSSGTFELHRHWSPYKSQADYGSVAHAASEIESLALDRIKRYGALRKPIVCDLTGGYDSRLVVSAVDHAEMLSGITVDGPQSSHDVRIAKRVAEAMAWPIEHFDTDSLWTEPITPDMRSELTYRTNGELPFTEVYHHLLARPALAGRYALHFTGGGGELLRFFPWSQEFLGIGRRKLANARNALIYRFFQEGPPSDDLFIHNWFPHLIKLFSADIESIFKREQGALTTQQLDAAYLWRMTGFAPYSSATFSWLPTAAPLMGAGVLDAALSVPWRMRLTTRLMRSMIYSLSPGAADVPTHYGGTGAPARLSNLHREAWQLMKQSYHLLSKLDRVLLKGVVTKLLPSASGHSATRKPYLTEEFRSFLDPDGMRSRGLYDPAGLARVLRGSPDDLYSRESLILRIATIEQLCREVDFEPEPDYLLKWMSGGI
jgi:hypothetical protein